jgi:ribonuclease HI
MAKKNFYAVRTGKVTGIFQTWDECKASVDGYPGAEYKGFSTEEAAKEYLAGGVKTRTVEVSPKLPKGASAKSCLKLSKAAKRPLPPQVACLPGQVVAYVDGSFDKKVKRYSFGCVLITPEGEIGEWSGNGDNPESLALRNVTGEMLGAMFAVKWCIKNNYPAIDIRYDYSGIEMWATGKWKTNNPLTQKYAAYMRQNGQRIKISFTKIAAHTGDYYNEMADKLAKKALTEGDGIPEIRNQETPS